MSRKKKKKISVQGPIHQMYHLFNEVRHRKTKKTIKNMWKWRCFLLPEKNFLDFGCQEATFFLKHFVRFKSRSLYFITNWDFFGRNFHAQVPSKLSSQIFLGGGDSQGSNCPNLTDFFWNFRCSTRSSVDDANRTDLLSVQLNLRKVGTWNFLRWALDFCGGGHGS